MSRSEVEIALNTLVKDIDRVYPGAFRISPVIRTSYMQIGSTEENIDLTSHFVIGKFVRLEAEHPEKTRLLNWQHQLSSMRVYLATPHVCLPGGKTWKEFNAKREAMFVPHSARAPFRVAAMQVLRNLVSGLRPAGPRI